MKTITAILLLVVEFMLFFIAVEPLWAKVVAIILLGIVIFLAVTDKSENKLNQ